MKRINSSISEYGPRTSEAMKGNSHISYSTRYALTGYGFFAAFFLVGTIIGTLIGYYSKH